MPSIATMPSRARRRHIGRAALLLALAVLLTACGGDDPVPIEMNRGPAATSPGVTPASVTAAPGLASPQELAVDGSVHPQRHDGRQHPQRHVPAYPGWETPVVERLRR